MREERRKEKKKKEEEKDEERKEVANSRRTKEMATGREPRGTRKRRTRVAVVEARPQFKKDKKRQPLGQKQ